MIERILEWSLKNRFMVMLASALLVVGGLNAMANLPIDAVPDVTNVQVQILTSSPALGPEEVEKFITTPVEQAMSGLPNLVEVRSTSKFGLSAVTVVFEDGTDIYFARQQIGERLIAAKEAIPEGYGDPEMGPVSTGLGEIFQFEVRGEGKTPMDLRTILEWEIAPRLRSVPGVVEVNSFGGELKTYEVRLRPDDMIRYDISLAQVVEALEKNNANAGGAYIEQGGEQYLVRGEGLVTSRDDIRDIVVATDDDGTPVYLHHLASVDFAAMVRQGAVTRDGRGEMVTGIVMMLMGENSREVSQRVEERLENIRGEPARRRDDRHVLRPHRPGQEDDQDGRHEPDRGRRSSSSPCCFLMLGNLRAGLLVARRSRCRCWSRSSGCGASAYPATSCRSARSTSG